MGINVTNNTNSNRLISVSKQVVPNASVVVPAYSSNGWTAGDYLYQSATGINAAPSGIVNIGGPITTLQATNVTVSNGGLFSGSQTLANIFSTSTVYTGPTTTTNNVFFTVTPSATAISGSNYCITLLNGNIVIAYFDSNNPTPGYYYAIYNPSGVVVLAPTFIANNGTAPSNVVGAVAEASGNFRIFYWTDAVSNRIVCNRYNSAGTFLNTVAATGAPNPTSSATTVRTIQLLNGNVVMAYLNSSLIIHHVLFNADNTANLVNASLTAQTDSPSKSFALYPFPITSTSISGGYGFTWWAGGIGASYFRAYDSNGSLVTGTNNTPSTFYDSMDIVRLQDGTYMGAYGNSSVTLTLTAFNLNTSTGAMSTFGTTSTRSYAQARPIKIIPMAGSGFALIYSNNSNQLFFERSLGLTPSAAPADLTPQTFIANVSGTPVFGATCGTNAFMYTTLLNPSSTNQFVGVATANLTNGAAVTATALTPPNYTFFGIAETTVSAGQTGNVIVSGSALANNSMPNVTGTLNFDFTQNPSFGNKGFVTGRNFTLKGFE